MQQSEAAGLPDYAMQHFGFAVSASRITPSSIAISWMANYSSLSDARHEMCHAKFFAVATSTQRHGRNDFIILR